MTKKGFILILYVALFVLFLQKPLHAATQVYLDPESKLWITGTSTLHSYTCVAHEIQAEVVFQPEVFRFKSTPEVVNEVIRKKHWKRFQLVIPVMSLRSGKKGLDKNMYKTMKAETHALITFSLKSLRQTQPVSKIIALGTLTIAGVAQHVELPAELEIHNDGFWIKGQKELLMTSFGMQPPKAMMGAIKTDDAVTVFYELFFRSN
ncbi:MAG: hypothetical protein A3I05_03270 [Deltaproteobacteria bacterium RIFCSPLOWO2_02_FULL_44_10]|nr:MAG: hypothetical protein A3C46_02845 [Deltaproteobacteria bacterium RIFCSPHIGHO2_02_FULL_44_16]OGQ46194.1 MAG: hypothetical protein A3I05_03270 [Deltaproteobacteria bacterium RIFCSPLOWO2_02_FULL_44_10]